MDGRQPGVLPQLLILAMFAIKTFFALFSYLELSGSLFFFF